MTQGRQGGVVRGGRPIGVALVRGRSMEPALAAGDRLLVRYGVPARVGDLVLARFPDGTLAVKRAVGRRPTRAGRDGWWLLSDNPGEGVDSRHRGVVAEQEIRGVVLARFWPRPGWLRGRG